MKIAILFYDGMTALDAIGPQEVLCSLPKVTILRVAKERALIRAGCGLVLSADYALADVPQADVLLVPGASNATTLRQYPEILAWIRAIHATTSWTTSVCTGSLILGAAGLLKGLAATSHWSTLDRLQLWGAEPKQQRIIEAGKIITAAGVSAGIDMALALAAKLAGQEVAEAIQLGIEYDPEPPFAAGSTLKANPVMVEALRARFQTAFESID